MLVVASLWLRESEPWGLKPRDGQAPQLHTQRECPGSLCCCSPTALPECQPPVQVRLFVTPRVSLLQEASLTPPRGLRSSRCCSSVCPVPSRPRNLSPRTDRASLVVAATVTDILLQISASQKEELADSSAIQMSWKWVPCHRPCVSRRGYHSIQTPRRNTVLLELRGRWREGWWRPWGKLLRRRGRNWVY